MKDSEQRSERCLSNGWIVTQRKPSVYILSEDTIVVNLSLVRVEKNFIDK